MPTWAGACQKKSSYKIVRFSVILNLSIKKVVLCKFWFDVHFYFSCVGKGNAKY